ncbi:MAG: dTDP-4-dehydrorhamnose 3,5-epimerase [Chloroflexi bacterium]|nr:dTDP-4-dehydrorhamnose 3,5-epimerase [Chloroflexota bacterium]
MQSQTNAPTTPAQEHEAIAGVYTVKLKAFADPRGRFMETFRREWFPWIDWTYMQGNFSESAAQVLRGLHFHRHQVDYWWLARGAIRVGLADLRPSSATYLKTAVFDLHADDPSGLLIPTGVAHGFLGLTTVGLSYLVNQYYDGSDEHGVAWDDPDLRLAWAVDAPVLSNRDLQNPRLRDLPAERLPR